MRVVAGAESAAAAATEEQQVDAAAEGGSGITSCALRCPRRGRCAARSASQWAGRSGSRASGAAQTAPASARFVRPAQARRWRWRRLGRRRPGRSESGARELRPTMAAGASGRLLLPGRRRSTSTSTTTSRATSTPAKRSSPSSSGRLPPHRPAAVRATDGADRNRPMASGAERPGRAAPTANRMGISCP